MEISVKTFKGEVMTFTIEPNESIKSVKRKIKDKENIPLSKQRLKYKEFYLEDEKLFSDYDIQNGCIVFLLIKTSIKIFINTPTGKTLTLDVEPNDSVKQVKNKIQTKESIPVEKQQLILAEKELEDEKKLSYCNIFEGATLNLHLKKNHMQIFVLYYYDKSKSSGKKIALEVDSEDRITDVKTKIQNKEGILYDKQYLTFASKNLEDDKTLLNYDIQQDSVLNLHFDVIHIYVRSYNADTGLYGNSVQFEVEPNDSISSVKTLIQNSFEISQYEQQLIFGERHLENAKNLSDYGIKNESILTLRLKGSMEIYIKFYYLDTHSYGNDIKVDVEPTDNFENLKTLIFNKTGVFPRKQQHLYYAGHLIENEKKTFKDYHIGDGYFIIVHQRYTQIFIEMSHRTEMLYIDLDDNIWDIKNVLEKREGIPKKQQQLIFQGRNLEDKKTLSYYGIEEKSTLLLDLGGCINISVQAPGFILPLNVDLSDTIEIIKDVIHIKKNIATHQQRLTFEEQYLEDWRPLAYYQIKEKSIINLDINPEFMEIFIKTLSGKTMHMLVDRYDTFWGLKLKIQKLEKIPCNQQRVIFNGIQPLDSDTMLKHNVQNNSTMHMVLKLSGC